MKEILKDAWDAVWEDFKLHKINSERSLQAILYNAIISTNAFDKYNNKIFIEPSIKEFIPDLIIIGDGKVKCIMEIKCSPHNIFGRGRIQKDFDKLENYKDMSPIYLEEFGENRVFDRKNIKWSPKVSSYKYIIDEATILCFAVLGLKEDKKLIEVINNYYNRENYCILAGLMTPDLKSNNNNSRFYLVKELISGA